MNLNDLVRNGPLITDGAWGTRLQQQGLAVGECPDIWNIQNPEKVEGVAGQYVEAGSDIILTNTFRANRLALGDYGLAHQVGEINKRGVEISLRAAKNKSLVFASVGPTGKLLMMGEVTEQQVGDCFFEQIKFLTETGASGIIIETMSDLAEAKLALAAAKEFKIPAIVSMVFDSGKNKDHTMMGISPEQAAAELTIAGADAIGANCGQGIENYLPVCERLSRATHLPVWIKPNAGMPRIEQEKIIYDTTPDDFCKYIPAMIAAGAGFIGGCCGTTPEFIRRIRMVLKNL